MDATYYVAGIDVHKKMLAVVVAMSEKQNYGSSAVGSVRQSANCGVYRRGCGRTPFRKL